LLTLASIHKGGKWIEGASKRHIDVVNPATEEVIARVAAGTSEDVDAAVKAAREAFDKLGYALFPFNHSILSVHYRGWSATSGKERASYLRAIAEKVKQHKEELARLESMDNGKPLKESLWDIGDVASCFEYCKFITVIKF